MWHLCNVHKEKVMLTMYRRLVSVWSTERPGYGKGDRSYFIFRFDSISVVMQRVSQQAAMENRLYRSTTEREERSVWSLLKSYPLCWARSLLD